MKFLTKNIDIDVNNVYKRISASAVDCFFVRENKYRLSLKDGAVVCGTLSFYNGKDGYHDSASLEKDEITFEISPISIRGRKQWFPHIEGEVVGSTVPKAPEVEIGMEPQGTFLFVKIILPEGYIYSNFPCFYYHHYEGLENFLKKIDPSVSIMSDGELSSGYKKTSPLHKWLIDNFPTELISVEKNMEKLQEWLTTCNKE